MNRQVVAQTEGKRSFSSHRRVIKAGTIYNVAQRKGCGHECVLVHPNYDTPAAIVHAILQRAVHTRRGGGL